MCTKYDSQNVINTVSVLYECAKVFRMRMANPASIETTCCKVMMSLFNPTKSDSFVSLLYSLCKETLLGQSIYAKLWLDPPHIATEAFSSDLLPERSPE